MRMVLLTVLEPISSDKEIAMLTGDCFRNLGFSLWLKLPSTLEGRNRKRETKLKDWADSAEECTMRKLSSKNIDAPLRQVSYFIFIC